MTSPFTKKYEQWYKIAGKQGSFPSSIPPDVQRKILTQFASRQQAAGATWDLQTEGTPLATPQFQGTEYEEAYHQFIINDVKLSILPENLVISEESHTFKSWTMRTAGLSKAKSGRAVIYVGASIPFVGAREINTKLLRIISQIRTIPIVYLENELIRQTVSPNDPKKNIAAIIRSATFSVHPQALNTIVLQLDMEIFNYEPFSKGFLFSTIIPQSHPIDKVKVLPSNINGPSKSPEKSLKLSLETVAPTAAVKTPMDSSLFKDYYDFLSGTRARNGEVRLPKEVDPKDKTSESGVSLKELTKVFQFLPVGSRLQNDIVFNYYIYKILTLPPSKKAEIKDSNDNKGQTVVTPVQPVAADSKGIVKANLLASKGITYAGLPYKFGAKGKEAMIFDCSGIVAYVIREEGVPCPDGGTNIFKWARENTSPAYIWDPNQQKGIPVQSNQIAVSQAVNIKGALLFKWDHVNHKVKHIGLTLGQGRVLEGLNPKKGVMITSSGKQIYGPKNRWHFAALIPGVLYDMNDRSTVIPYEEGVGFEGQRLYELVQLKVQAKKINLTGFTHANNLPDAYRSQQEEFQAREALRELLIEYMGKDFEKRIPQESGGGTVGQRAFQNAWTSYKKAEKIALKAMAKVPSTLTPSRQGTSTTPTTSPSIPNPVALPDPVLRAAKDAEDYLKAWVDYTKQWEKSKEGQGWERIFTRDGALIYRKKVTFAISDQGPGSIGLPSWISPAAITANISNIFARIPMMGHYLATHQYFGSGDGEVTITFLVTGNQKIAHLKYMHQYCEAAARILRRVPEAGVIQMKSDVTCLLGFDKYTIDNFTVETVEDSPNLYRVTLKLSEWKRDFDNSEIVEQEFITNKDEKAAALEKLAQLYLERFFPKVYYGDTLKRSYLASISPRGEQVGRSQRASQMMETTQKPLSDPVIKAISEISEAIDRHLGQILSSDLLQFLGWGYSSPEQKKALETKFANKESPFYLYGFHKVLFQDPIYVGQSISGSQSQAGVLENRQLRYAIPYAGSSKYVSPEGETGKFEYKNLTDREKLLSNALLSGLNAVLVAKGSNDGFFSLSEQVRSLILLINTLQSAKAKVSLMEIEQKIGASSRLSALYQVIKTKVIQGNASVENATNLSSLIQGQFKADRDTLQSTRLRIAAQVFLRFEELRYEIGQIFQKYTHKWQLLEQPEMDGIRLLIDENSSFYSGRPAYTDLPVIKHMVPDLDNPGRSMYIYANPDLFFHNDSDKLASGMDKAGAAVLATRFTHSMQLVHDFSVDFKGKRTFSDLANGKPHAAWDSVDPKQALGKYTQPPYVSYGTVGQESILKNPYFLPESVLMESNPQPVLTKLPYKLQFGKQEIKFGESDNAMSHQKMVDAKKTGEPLSSVYFGSSSNAELSVSTFMERSPETMQKMLQYASLTYTDKTFLMRRALPAFKLYFREVDTSGAGGLNEAYLRSYDDFFSYNAIKSIKFIESRKMPASLLIIRLSNLFGHIDTAQFDFTHTVPGSQATSDDNSVLRTPTNEEVKESLDPFLQDTSHENPFARLVLREGMNIHFRLGYDNNPRGLKQIFNGQIVQINQNSADEIIIVAQSYATQLVAYQKGLDRTDIPIEWRDTFELLSWLICQPECTHFGRWTLDAGLSIGQSKTTGGWEKIFKFLEKPQDDNIYAPSRTDMISYFCDVGWWSKHISGYGTSIPELIFSVVFGSSLTGETGGRTLVNVTVPNPEKPTESKTTQMLIPTGRGKSRILDYHVYRTTIWDVFKEMELRHPGWIAHPVPYGNRMTMFFGLPSQFYWSRPLTAIETMETRQYNQLIRQELKRLKMDESAKPGVPTRALSWLMGPGTGAFIVRNLIRVGIAVGAGIATSASFGAAAGVAFLATGAVFSLLSAGVDKHKATLLGQQIAQQQVASHLNRRAVWSEIASGRLRPFRNYHFLTSANHIIANGIKCSSHGVYNAISLDYIKSAEGKADVQKPGSTATMVVKASDRILDKDIHMLSASYLNCRGEYMANRYSQGLLMRHLRDMYKGSLYVLGNEDIHPYDICCIADAYSDMWGAIQVEQVIHSLSPEEGFITEITPDMVLYGNDLIDMPYDDYMGAQKAFEQLSLSELATSSLLRGGQYYRTLRQNQNNADTYTQQSILGQPVNPNLTSSSRNQWSPGEIAGSVLSLGIYPLITYLHKATAIKYYDWTIKRNPIIFQPLVVAGRPYMAGMSGFNTVNMLQFIKDQYVPIITNIEKGLLSYRNGLMEFYNYLTEPDNRD